MKYLTIIAIAAACAVPAHANWITNLFESDTDRVARECKEEFYRTASLEQIVNYQEAKDRALEEARERSFAERYPELYAKYLSDQQKYDNIRMTDYVSFR